MKLYGVSDTECENMTTSYNADLYKKFLKPGSVVYDIGAWRGVLTRLFSLDDYYVVAFEGSPRNVPDLFRNTHGYNYVEIHPVALHRREYSTRTRFNDCLGPEHPEQNINYVVLDDYIEKNDIPSPSLIKMDIEGMESVVLQGATNLLTKVRPCWQLSLHENHKFSYSDYPSWQSKENGGFDFSTFFTLGYKVFDMNENELSSIKGFGEFFIVPKELL
jgi:FkbM family methyltransferase